MFLSIQKRNLRFSASVPNPAAIRLETPSRQAFAYQGSSSTSQGIRLLEEKWRESVFAFNFLFVTLSGVSDLRSFKTS